MPLFYYVGCFALLCLNHSFHSSVCESNMLPKSNGFILMNSPNANANANAMHVCACGPRYPFCLTFVEYSEYAYMC